MTSANEAEVLREQLLQGAVRRVVDEHRARLRRALEARGEIDGVAECRVLDAQPTADLPDDDRAGRGSDAHAEALDPPAASDLAAVVVDLGDDPKRSAHRTLGVV